MRDILYVVTVVALIAIWIIPMPAYGCVHSLQYYYEYGCTSGPTFTYPVITDTITNGKLSSGFGGVVDYVHSVTYSPDVCNGENLPLSPSCPSSLTVRAAIMLGNDVDANAAEKLCGLIAQTMLNLKKGEVMTVSKQSAIKNAFSSFPAFQEMTHICEEAELGVADPTIYTNALAVFNSLNDPRIHPPCIEEVACTSSHSCISVGNCSLIRCYNDLTCTNTPTNNGSPCLVELNDDCKTHECFQGECIPNHQPMGMSCTTSNMCIIDATCDGSGNCVQGTKVICNSPPTELGSCGKGTCNPSDGACSYVAISDCTPCEDDAACVSPTDTFCSRYTCNTIMGVCEKTLPNEGEICDASSSTECRQYRCNGGECTSIDASPSSPCTPDDLCALTGVCDGTGGCLVDQIKVCENPSVCISSQCSMITGECELYTIVNCTTPCTKDSDCPSSDLCSIPICGENGECVNTSMQCDDSDPCTIDDCNNGECVHIPVQCGDPADTCNPEVCNSSTGKCDSLPGPCIQQDPCIHGICKNGDDGSYSCELIQIESCTTSCINDTQCMTDDDCQIEYCSDMGFCTLLEASCGTRLEGGCEVRECNNGVCEHERMAITTYECDAPPPDACVHPITFWSRYTSSCPDNRVRWPYFIDPRNAQFVLNRVHPKHNTTKYIDAPCISPYTLSLAGLGSSASIVDILHGTPSATNATTATEILSDMFQREYIWYMLNLGWAYHHDNRSIHHEFNSSRVVDVVSLHKSPTRWGDESLLPVMQYIVEFNTGLGIYPPCSEGDHTHPDLEYVYKRMGYAQTSVTDDGKPPDTFFFYYTKNPDGTYHYNVTDHGIIAFIAMGAFAFLLLLIIVVSCAVRLREKYKRESLLTDDELEMYNLNPEERVYIMDRTGGEPYLHTGYNYIIITSVPLSLI